MATDIQLDAEDGNYVVIDSHVLKTTVSDFILDAPARRAANKRGSRGLRRARTRANGSQRRQNTIRNAILKRSDHG